MKRYHILRLTLALLFLMLLGGCRQAEPETDAVRIVATTYPMAYLTEQICAGIPELQVDSLISEPVSCLHNYTITTGQMKLLDRADVLVMNGAGLEEFLEGALVYIPETERIDASADLTLLPGDEDEWDPHVWLSPFCYAQQGETVAEALAERYPEYETELLANAAALEQQLSALQEELTAELSDLSCRELITFHDGFSYFAQAFDLTIAAAVEEEEGAETPARELRALCALVEERKIPAVFAERNGSQNASSVISSETGVPVFILNTMMDGETDYMTAMRENIAAVKEALS